MMYGEGCRGIPKHTLVYANTPSPSAERSEYDGFMLTGSDSLPVPTDVDKRYCSILFIPVLFRLRGGYAYS